MAKLTLTDLANLQNETTAVNAINSNNTAIENAVENTLSRNGAAPNQMQADLDMNSNHILNLPQPTSATEPLRFQDLADFTGGSLVIPVLATQAEAEAGTENSHFMSPLRTRQSLLFTQTGTGAVTRTISAKLKDEALTPQDFGGIGDSTNGVNGTDNATAFTNLFAAAIAQGKPVYLPKGNYRTSVSIGLSFPVSIFGDGQDLSVIYYSGAGEGMLIVPPIGGVGDTGHFLRDFSILPSVGGGGTNGLHIQLPALGYYAFFDWYSVRIGNFGTRSVFLDNSIGNVDGFFVGQVDSCQFDNSCKFQAVGDSLSFSNNKIGGVPVLEHTQVAGSRRCVYYNNNITNTGGIDFNGAFGVDFLYNHVEIFATGGYTGSTNAAIRFNNCINVTFTGNRIGLPTPGTKPNDTLLFSGTTSFATVDSCEFAKGNNTHINTDTTTADIYVGKAKVDSGTEVFTLIGSRNEWLDKPCKLLVDANYSILPSDEILVLSAVLTANRTLTLPLGTSCISGKTYTFLDTAGGLGTFGWVITANGSDTIQGVPSVTISTQLSRYILTLATAVTWSAGVVPLSQGGTGASTAANARTNLGLGTAATQNTGTSGTTLPFLDGTNTFTGIQTITTAASVGTPIIVTSTNADANAGPVLQLFRNSPSPAASDALGYVQFAGNSSTGVVREFGGLQMRMLDATNTSEDGRFEFITTRNGTSNFAMKVAQGLMLGTGVSTDPGDGSLIATGSILSNSPTAGVGYGTGAGATVTQLTNRTTGVTINNIVGRVTTNNASLAAGAAASFTVTNSAVGANDVVILSIAAGLTTVQTHVNVTTLSAGSFIITVDNQHASTAEVGAISINFAVIKGVTS